MVGTACALFTWVSAPASQASTTTTLASAFEAATRALSSS